MCSKFKHHSYHMYEELVLYSLVSKRFQCHFGNEIKHDTFFHFHRVFHANISFKWKYVISKM